MNIKAPVIFSSLYNVGLKFCLIFTGAVVLAFFPPRQALKLLHTGRFTEFRLCIHEIETNRLNFLRSYRTVNG